MFFASRKRERNPLVIKKTLSSQRSDIYTYDHERLQGNYHRIYPTSTDYFALVCMIHRVDKFAPAIGEGVIISDKCLEVLDNKIKSQ